MPPVVTIVPPATRVATSTPSAPINAAPGISASVGQIQQAEEQHLDPFTESEGIRVEIWEVIRESTALDGALRSLISHKRGRSGLGTSYSESDGACVLFRQEVPPRRVTAPVGALQFAQLL